MNVFRIPGLTLSFRASTESAERVKLDSLGRGPYYFPSMRTDEVFGISPKVRPASYVDRGQLDEQIARHLDRTTHIALRGESKCGKSWLRQQAIPDGIVVQCRLSKSVADMYSDALSQLDIKFVVSSQTGGAIKGSVTAKGEFGMKLLAKAGIEVTTQIEGNKSQTSRPAGHDIEDLRFVADILKASTKRLVIEDFHYMTMEERRKFAFDLKALWDYGLFVVIVGVWSQSNMLLHLNPDLSGRVHELPIEWSKDDLGRVLKKGGAALHLGFTPRMIDRLTDMSFGNVGLLQKLTLMTLDEAGIKEGVYFQQDFDSPAQVESAALDYAEQLNPLYQQFARNVSSGIRSRKNSTGIYAHAMAAIMQASDDQLVNGLNVTSIFAVANARQPRIQRGNLKSVLEKIEELQIDSDGRGLVLAYNSANEEITAVDRQLLLYRKYCTVKWPWEDLIAEAGEDTLGPASAAPMQTTV
jgi:hypothetical protein